MAPDERMASIHILHVDGRVASAGSATIEMVARLPVVGPLLARIGRLGPMRRFAEASYRTVARHRHQLARFVRDTEPVIRWRTQP